MQMRRLAEEDQLMMNIWERVRDNCCLLLVYLACCAVLSVSSSCCDVDGGHRRRRGRNDAQPEAIS